MNYFYVLLSKKDSKCYYGSTIDLKNRFKQHCNGKVTSTCHRLPVELVYYEAYLTIDGARKRERQVKQSGSIRSALLKRININLV